MCDRQSVGLRGMLKDSRWWYASVCRAESGKKMKTHSCVSDRRELSAGSREDVVGLTSLGSRMVWLDGHLSLLRPRKVIQVLFTSKIPIPNSANTSNKKDLQQLQ